MYLDMSTNNGVDITMDSPGIPTQNVTSLALHTEDILSTAGNFC